MIILKRTDPNKHMDRWYCLDITTDLFGQPCLYRAWGNRRTAYQHVRCDPFTAAPEAVSVAQKLIALRRQHGYEEIYNDQTILAEGVEIERR
jgi:predicted DNA-binding WGR domain protein